MQVEYVQHWGDDLIVCNAARVSFDKRSHWELRADPTVDPREGPAGEIAVLSDRDSKLVNYLAKHKHTSCFEHMGATLKLKVPIFIARQIQRHRTFSYNEISRRYVDSQPEFFWPDKWRKRADNVKQGSSDEEVKTFGKVWGFDYSEEDFKSTDTVQGAAEYAIAHSVETYNQMLEAGVAPELARMILPQNMYTEFYMSGNLRAWAHFLHLRLDGHAQKEVQDVAKMVEEILTPLFHVSMKALMDNP